MATAIITRESVPPTASPELITPSDPASVFPLPAGDALPPAERGTQPTVDACFDAVLFTGREYRLRVQQYWEMARAGILTASDHVELIEGRLVSKMTKYPHHVLATKLALEALATVLPRDWHLAQDAPVDLIGSVPEPDVMVLRGGPRDFRDRTPGREDVALVVEVADSSLGADRTVMKRLYARAGIPSFWILNLSDRCLEIHADPTGPVENPDYRVRVVHGLDDPVTVLIEGQGVGQVTVRELLP